MLPIPVDWQKLNPGKKLVVEIGSGHGEVLLENSRENTIIGFETKRRFYKKCKSKIRNQPTAYIYSCSGYDGVMYYFLDQIIDELLILFPDPWHKKRHNKRRPITSEFFSAVHKKLAPNGQILVATDWEDYFNFIIEHTKEVTELYTVTTGLFSPEDWKLPRTHYYSKWQKYGRKAQFVLLRKR